MILCMAHLLEVLHLLTEILFDEPNEELVES